MSDNKNQTKGIIKMSKQMKQIQLTRKQKDLVDSHYKSIMQISNDFRRRNRDLLLIKKLSKDDVEQIALMKACEIALKSETIRNEFSTYLYNTLPFDIGREVNSYNIVKIPRRDNWDLEGHEELREEYNSVLRHGIGELDKPLDNNDGEGEVFTVMDRFDVDSAEEDQEYEKLLLQETLIKHVGQDMAQALILQSDDFSLKQIADKLGIKVTTLRNRLYKAKDDIKSLTTRETLFRPI